MKEEVALKRREKSSMPLFVHVHNITKTPMIQRPAMYSWDNYVYTTLSILRSICDVILAVCVYIRFPGWISEGVHC